MYNIQGKIQIINGNIDNIHGKIEEVVGIMAHLLLKWWLHYCQRWRLQLSKMEASNMEASNCQNLATNHPFFLPC